MLLLASTAVLALLFVANAVARTAFGGMDGIASLGAAVLTALLLATLLALVAARVARGLAPLSARLAPSALLLLAMMPLTTRTASAPSLQALLFGAAAMTLGVVVRWVDVVGGSPSSARLGAGAALLVGVFGGVGPLAAARGWLAPRSAAAVLEAATHVPISTSRIETWGRLLWRPLRPWLDSAPIAALFADVWGDYHGRWLLVPGRNSERVREQTIDYLGRVNRLALLPSALLLVGWARGAYSAFAGDAARRDRAHAVRALLSLAALAALAGYLWADDVALTAWMLHAVLPLALLAADALEALAARSRGLYAATMAALAAVMAHDVAALITRVGAWAV
ncbi:MAG: hypothetical protein KC503_08945 [Myxococcales bacterium]|nr:hypothetical protein [Myxococcales bacterium]